MPYTYTELDLGVSQMCCHVASVSQNVSLCHRHDLQEGFGKKDLNC